jgi:hypothetical protein
MVPIFFGGGRGSQSRSRPFLVNGKSLIHLGNRSPDFPAHTLVTNTLAKRSPEDAGVREQDNIKMYSKGTRQGGVAWTEGPLVGSCKCGNGAAVSMNCRGFF